MVSKCFASRIVLIGIFTLIACIVSAQPTLPGISGAADKDIVVLTWNCQYDGVKAISVLRSMDSLANYSTIGNVKKLEKGIQVFVDAVPARGKNFYKLNILFKSGLKWTSNYCIVYINPAPIAPLPVLPKNDTSPRLVIANPKPPKNKEIMANIAKPKVSVANGADTNNIYTQPTTKKPAAAVLKPRFNLNYNDPSLSMPTFIKPMYINADPFSGQVTINLPDNVRGHRYDVKFYDQQSRTALEIPFINAPKVIIDRKNFQHKGLYKFVLHKDGLELETGYIAIN